MKVLIIDNGTNYLPQLENLLSGHAFQVVKYSEINTINSDDFSAIVFSGGHDFPVNGNANRLQKEIDLVINSKNPLFGICFGFEVIAYAFGARLERMQKKSMGF